MPTNAFPALKSAVHYLRAQRVPIPADVIANLKELGVDPISADYSGALMEALHNYAEGRMGMVEARNDFRQTMTRSFSAALDAGYADGGGDPDNMTAAAIDWLYQREQDETQNILELFRTLKEQLAIDPPVDIGSWISDRSAGYVNTLQAVYSQGKVFGAGDKLLTFEGDDGAESCPDCQRMKGQTHPASWWIENDMIPGTPGTENYACHGYRCEHYLVDLAGNRFTQ